MRQQATIVLGLLATLPLIPAAAFADALTDGASKTADVNLTTVVDEPTDLWQVLLSRAITLTTPSNCAVTACGDADKPDAGGGIYRFVVATSKNPGLDTASERTIELINNALADNISVNDPDSWPVCSTRFFGNVAPGSRTFYFLGSKDSTSVENTLILDSSMTVSCTDSLGLESTDSSSEENAFPTD